MITWPHLIHIDNIDKMSKTLRQTKLEEFFLRTPAPKSITTEEESYIVSGREQI